MAVEVEGSENRVAGRDYLEINMGNEADKEPLSSAQRQKLNALVANVSETLSLDPRSVWREVVHARIGVDSINDIPRSAYQDAYDELIRFRDTERERVNIKLLVSKITTVTKAKSIYSERDGFCLRTFGESHLNYMSIDQLRQVLAFVEDLEVVAPEPKPAGQLTPSAVLAVVMDYPVHFGITLVVGALAGQILL